MQLAPKKPVCDPLYSLMSPVPSGVQGSVATGLYQDAELGVLTKLPVVADSAPAQLC